MKHDCELVRDLLPLYVDGICSPVSKNVIEEHLQECPECAAILRKMRQGNSIDKEIELEKEEVINHQAKYFKRKGAVAGGIISAIFMLPILICLIVNIASGSGIGWFFIVLTSLLVGGSLCITPFLAPRHKGLWTLATFVISLILFFFTVCVYTHGHWFFIVSSATLFGLSVIFLPIVMHTAPAKKIFGKRNGWITVAGIVFLFVQMLFFISLRESEAGFFRQAVSISAPFVVLFIGMYLLIALPKYNGLIKAATCIALTGSVIFYGNFFSNLLMGRFEKIPLFMPLNPPAWNTGYNVAWVIFFILLFIAAIFLLAGLQKGKRK